MNPKTALITGASRGIGAETARKLAQAGYAVILNYHHSQAQALALQAELTAEGHSALALHADIADPVQVQEMVDNVLEKFCQLDILLCNAGVAWQGLLSDMSDADWRYITSVNLDGTFYCCRAVYPHMVRKKRGKIITISSVWGTTGASCEVAYSATKAGIIGLTKALAKELGPSGITVNCIAPGVIQTEMIQNLGIQALQDLADETPLGRLGTCSDVAETVLWLASDAANFITGQVLGVDGGF